MTLLNIIIAIAAFVAGVLVGRRNKNKVEAAVAEVKAIKVKKK